MKIDSTASHESAATRQVETNRESDRAKAERQTQTGSDHVSISSDAALLARELEAVGHTPDVRSDMVTEMRDLLAQGKIGGDAERLADSIIDRLLEDQNIGPKG